MFTVSRLVRINQVVRCKVITETRFNDTFYYFWYKREVVNWAAVREFIFVQGRFLEEGWYDRFFESVVKVTRAEWQINYVSDSRNQECRAFFEKPRSKILEISDSEAGLKVEKSGSQKFLLSALTSSAFYTSEHLLRNTIGKSEQIFVATDLRLSSQTVYYIVKD